jgi:hypothetical protein
VTILDSSAAIVLTHVETGAAHAAGATLVRAQA